MGPAVTSPEERMQDNETRTWFARDGDGRILEADPAGHPRGEVSPGDGRPVAEAADTAATYVHDLKELDEPGLTPGAPHPDPALAANGWHVCDHGIYTRHRDGQLEAEPEAC
jgi:hypothetical protein